MNYDIFTMDPDGSNQTNLTFSVLPVDQDPDWSPDGTKIVFFSNIDNFDNSEIYLMDANGANVVRLTDNPAAEINPAWSPDGTKIAFVTNRDGNWEVYVMDANGSNPINLTNNAARDGLVGICWSPDGGKLAFTSDRDDGSQEIYVMDANGSNPIRLTNREGDDITPDWSPDGTKIAFSNVEDPGGVDNDMYVMDADGSNQIDLTPDTSVADFDPAWSPDGTKIAFTRVILSTNNTEVFVMDSDGSNQIDVSNRPQIDYRPDWQRLAPGPSPTPGVTPIPSPTPTPSQTPTPSPTLTPGTPTPFPTPILPPAGNGKIVFESTRSSSGQNIYVMNADGTNPIGVTNDSSFNGYATWSPDGTKIAFASDRDGNSEIYVMDADGSNANRLTNHPAIDAKPTWSPDGTKIAFSSNRDSNLDIYVMDPDGSNLTRLTTDFLDDDRPAWSPDGGKIAFTSNRDGGSDVYLMDANGANQINLTNRAGADNTPAWSPDGTKIAFSSNRSGSGIFVMKPDGTDVTRLTTSPGNFVDSGAAWSPDGTKIVFHRTLSNGNPEIFVMDADGSNQTNVTNNAALDIRPDWQRVALTPSPTPAPTATPTPPIPTPTATPSPSPGRALNISTRMLVQTGDGVGIGGFIITGSAPKLVTVRGLGPSLAGLGVPNTLADPILELHGPSGFTTIINDNWRDSQEGCLATPDLRPTNDQESALCGVSLAPGAYTAIVRGKNNGTGIGLVEVYDLGPAASKLANISTRAFVGTGANVLIGGFILGGGANSNIEIFGVGPSLAASGVSGVLADPTLELRNSSGALVASNDNCGAASIHPLDPAEACIDISLPPGLFTAILAGKNGGTGVGLLEIYHLQ